jgi:hypothetical protein
MLVIAAMSRLGTINSDGTIASCPYTNVNGVCPVKFLQLVLYAHSTTRFFKSQSSLLTLQILVRAFFEILLKYYTAPLAWGWYGVFLW